MKRKKWILFPASAVLLAAGAAALLVWNGVILLNNPRLKDYPVRGVDVSSYQGDIDWDVLAAQDIRFAFIKATEGSAYTDPKFAYNWAQASETGLAVGAYHFFSYDSGGDTQAAHFIDTVPDSIPRGGLLPPVIDVEFYGDKEKNPPARADVDRELSKMAALLTEHYGRPPVLYATQKSYDLYLKGAYEDCAIWIRSVVFSPRLKGREILSGGQTARPGPQGQERESSAGTAGWTFWQYTNRARLKGYEGKERFIDMNVFRGGEKDFGAYVKQGQTEE